MIWRVMILKQTLNFNKAKLARSAQADYVGMSLEDWQAIGQKSTAEQERADRINAVTVGVSMKNGLTLALTL